MVTWIPSIYPLDLSIFLPAPWIRHGNGTHWPVREAGPGLTELTGLGSGYKFATPPSPNLEKLLGTPGDATGMPPTGVFPPELARNDVQKRTAILKCHLNAEKYDIISLW